MVSVEAEDNSTPFARDVILNRLLEAFGAWSTCTKKVFRWQISPCLYVAMLEADRGTIVTPWDEGRDTKPYWGKINYAQFKDGQPVKEGRSTNLASYAPSLGWDKDILYLSPMTHWELAKTVEFIRRKSLGVPIEDVGEPDASSPILGIGAKGYGDGGRGPISWAVVRAVFDRDGRRCVWCGSTENLHIDHIIPRAEGGGNDLMNLQVLCKNCNLSKSNRI